MNKVRYILVLCLLYCSAVLSAQTYEQVSRRQIWSTSENINGMRQDTVSVSYAEITGAYETGGFRDTWQPGQAWKVGASTASIRHLSKMTLAGGFSFTQSEGYDMCGSMFIYPGSFPVDVMEFTPGHKTLQTYKFDGGLSYDATSNFRIGAMVDFESSNIAKRKDLRHSNYHLDMTFSPGITYREGDITIGANYIFRKVSESIEAEQIGTKENSYYAFLDKGQMYGIYSIWSGSGLHLDESGVSGFPVNEVNSGMAFQIQYSDAYAEVEFRRISGSAGEKEFIWFRYPGSEISGHAGYRFDAGKVSHHFRLEYGWRDIKMSESVLEKVTEGGVTNVFNHGSNDILSESDWYFRPEYEYVSGKADILVNMDLSSSRSVSSQIYPYMYKEMLMTWSLGAEAKLYLGRFNRSLRGLEFDAGLWYRDGVVSERGGMVNEGTGVLVEPFRLTEYRDRQMEYATASVINMKLALKYGFWKGLYVKASGECLCGLALKYIPGHFRAAATISFGYDF